MSAALPQFNWIDWVIVGVVLFFVIRGWFRGFLSLSASFLSVSIALLVAIKLETITGPFLTDKFGINPSWASVVSYLAIAMTTELIASSLFTRLILYLPRSIRESTVSQVFGALLSGLNGLVILMFFLVIFLALPFKGTVRDDIKHAFLAPKLLGWIEKNGKPIYNAFDTSAKDLTQFLTIQPGSTDSISLNVTIQEKDLKDDEETEKQMLLLINEERVIRNIEPILMDPNMQKVARTNSRNMFLRGYFSHIDETGHDAYFRLQKAGISASQIAENLAYAPDLKTAHDGLMKSEGHKANIINPVFKRVGIGVVDGGLWGKMFTQEFAN